MHTKAATAVAMQEQGLIPGNQYAMWLGPIGYHDYEGFVSTPEEGERLSKAFGNGQIVLQKAHGFVLWGHSIHEAYMLAFLLNPRLRGADLLARRRGEALRAAAIGGRHRARAGPHHHRRQRAVQSHDLARLLRKLDRVAPNTRPEAPAFRAAPMRIAAELA